MLTRCDDVAVKADTLRMYERRWITSDEDLWKVEKALDLTE